MSCITSKRETISGNTHEVMNLCASSYPAVVVGDAPLPSSPLASDSESSTTARKPSPTGCAFKFVAPSAVAAAAAMGVRAGGTTTRIDGRRRTAEVVPFVGSFFGFDFRAGTAEEEQPLSGRFFFVTLGDGGAAGGGDREGGGGGDGNDDGAALAAATDCSSKGEEGEGEGEGEGRVLGFFGLLPLFLSSEPAGGSIIGPGWDFDGEVAAPAAPAAGAVVTPVPVPAFPPA